MTELQRTQQFTIENATSDDVAGIGAAHFESTKAAYPNEQAGINVAWIEQTWGSLVEEGGNEFRRGTVKSAEDDPDHNLYLAAKDAEDKVVGFVHATKAEAKAKLEGLYLLEEAQGSGLADDLMTRVLDFAGGLPIELQVADYNERAIAFYRKHGFEIVEGSNAVIKEKLPVITMLRSSSGGI